MMNNLGIDLWTKRCWLAYTLEWIIFTLPWVPRIQLVNEIKKIIKEKNINKIVIWLPYDLFWKDHLQLDKTQKFISKLREILPSVSIDSIDERYTTFESLNILNQLDEKKSVKEKKDSLSAFLILESYINKNS